MKWVVGANQPGALPLAEPVTHDSWSDAWSYLIEQMEWAVLHHGPSTIEFETAREQALMARAGTPFSCFALGVVWWIADVG